MPAEDKKRAAYRALADRVLNGEGTAFGFQLLTPEGFEAGARYLLKRGDQIARRPIGASEKGRQCS